MPTEFDERPFREVKNPAWLLDITRYAYMGLGNPDGLVLALPPLPIHYMVVVEL